MVNLTLPNGSSQERVHSFALPHNSTLNREVTTPLSTIAPMHLSRGRDIDLSNVKARPARTSYCALLNVINFTIYFVRGTEEQANGARIIPSLVTPQPLLMLISYRYRELCRVSFNKWLLFKHISPKSKTRHGHLGFDARIIPSLVTPPTPISINILQV